MALPYVITLTCVAISEFPADDIEAASDYVFVEFEVADAESSNDAIVQNMGLNDDPDSVTFRIHQTQRDDFTEGNDYDFSVSAA